MGNVVIPSRASSKPKDRSRYRGLVRTASKNVQVGAGGGRLLRAGWFVPPPKEGGSYVNTSVEDFEAWVHARSGALARSAYLLTGDTHSAEDLVQETLARLAQRWRGVARQGDTNAYAYRVMHNLAIDRWRRRQRRPQEVAPAGDPLGAGGYSIDDAADQTERRLLLRDALQQLTPKQRAVLVLRYYEDYSESQTAHVLGCSPNTVKSQTRQALARLKFLAPDVIAEFDGTTEVVQ